ncbi:hypothetical protein CesoFtcFv8_023365 [Champsocephalus esox]|uniref:Echinoderm microtubule-associated protein-like 1 n=1 Tax=Champsocephalus esox TaxID=159716 RepID=A0AAN8GHI4_9TELE|nr:hypothetical protein CesoFtcFv8_023365 [Champsocephalus esox]
MAEGVEEGDSHMEELVDHGLGMEEPVHSPQRRPSLKESYHSDSLLAPDTDFMTDDRSSASGLDVVDRLTYLEQRMQMQEDEIQLLKMALADVLKRLNISEEHQAAAAGGRRTSGAKARPVSLALPSRPSLVPSSAASLKKSTTLPSSSTARNYSPTPPRSGVWSPAGSVKDSPGKTTKRPTSTASTASTSKKPQEGSKSKEPAAVSGGTSRVTHCKVTMQIYLSPLTRRTGSSEFAKSTSTVPANCGSAAPNNPQAKGGGKPGAKKTSPSFILNLQKTTTSQSTAQHDFSSYKSPVKSPSQYFQICY